MTRTYSPSETPAVLDVSPTREPLEFHRRLPGYAPTPLIDARGIAAELGLGRVWVKDESSRLDLPSFKILGASWAIYRVLEQKFGGLGEWTSIDELRGLLTSHLPMGLAAATDGNHGRAVAHMARLLGLEARIFVPAGTVDARIHGIESEGALCTVVDGTYEDAVARSAEEASGRCLVISDTSWPGYEEVPRWAFEGYSTIFWEIDDELEALGSPGPDVVAVQIGVGALGAAAVSHFRRSGVDPRPAMIAMEPERAACLFASMEAGRVVTIPGPHDSIMAGLNCGTPSAVAWPLTSRGFDLYMAIDDERAREGMRMLAKEGIVSGETGAGGLGCLLEIVSGPSDLAASLSLSEASRVLLISTEGATDPVSYGDIVGHAPRP